MEPIPIWIDCDPGVDDAVALLLARRMEAICLRGLSAVAGNVALEKTCANLLKVRALMGADCPVYAGAARPLRRAPIDASFFHGPDGLGGVTLPDPGLLPEPAPAWEALYQAARREPGRLHLIALGPLTNVATAFALHSDLPGLLARVLLMGGAVQGGNRTPWAEFNVYADPEAAQQVFSAQVPLVMCGLDVTTRAYLTREELDNLSACGAPQVMALRRMQDRALNRVLAAGAPGLAMHDPCPVLCLGYPELFQGRSARVRVLTEDGPQLGRTLADFESDSPNCMVVLGVDRPAFVQVLTEHLARYTG